MSSVKHTALAQSAPTHFCDAVKVLTVPFAITEGVLWTVELHLLRSLQRLGSCKAYLNGLQTSECLAYLASMHWVERLFASRPNSSNETCTSAVPHYKHQLQ